VTIPPRGALNGTRLEAFSDGVFAIAITLLVLDLAVPARNQIRPGGLLAYLRGQWPSYVAYLVSFLIIGIIWVNHHTVFSKVRMVDRPVLFANLALLLIVSAIPFPTRLLAAYVTTGGSDAQVAAAIYSTNMLAMGLTYCLLWAAMTRDARLLHEHVDRAASRAALVRFGGGSLLYLITIGLSFVSPLTTLAVHAGLAAYFCVDQLADTERLVR
jgi:uncharacterized membrane protein